MGRLPLRVWWVDTQGWSLLWGRDGEGFHSRVDPLIPFVDQHDRDVIGDRVFSPTVLADQPGLFVIGQQTRLFTYTGRAAQDLQQFLTDHNLSQRYFH